MIETAPPISVVITTFNQSQFLPRAIDSVKANTAQPLEILVVDDGSGDRESEAICTAHGNVRHFRQANQGVSAARNTGAANASSEWILFLDADDLLLPTAISALGQAAMLSPESAFVIGRSERRSGDSSSGISQSPEIAGTTDPYCDFLAQATLWHPAQVLFKRRLLLSSGGWVLKQGAEDLELVLRLATRYPYKVLPAIVSIYWQHSSNVSGNPWRMYRSISTCFRAHRNDPMFNTRSGAVFRAAKASRLDFYCRGILLSGLSDIRHRRHPLNLLKGLAFVAAKRPVVLAWFIRFLVLRMFGRHTMTAQQR
ncbi:MAG TPA: glycosyltransferase family 2 protein [Opitutaceae bacterium]|nr:glycosyltransferase family 2 protein [Opitutaceae bacterium]